MARIGIVGIYFHRGQSEVNRTIRQALLDNGHEVYMFARMGHVYNQPMQEKDDPYWQLPNVYFYPKYEIPTPVLEVWAKVNHLDAIVFNEEYRPELGIAIHNMGLKTIHYIDFISDSWGNGLRQGYDQLWSATQRTTRLLNRMGLEDLTINIGWSLNPFLPYLGDQEPQYDFFSNQGYLGLNLRKGLDLLLEAFNLLNKDTEQYSLLIHAQVPFKATGLKDVPGLTWLTEVHPPPGLYHLGRICVQPSRLEGLGLTIPEALYQRRTVITTDAPPMSEFVLLKRHRARVSSTSMRVDGLSFPECVADIEDLAHLMKLSLPVWRDDGHIAKCHANDMFNWSEFCTRIQISLTAIGLEV